MKITGVIFNGKNEKNEIIAPKLGCPLEVVVSYESKEGIIIEDLVINLDIRDAFGNKCISIGNGFADEKIINPQSKGKVLCYIPKCQLYPGQYIYTISCLANFNKSDKVYDAGVFTVETGNYYKSGNLPSNKNSSFLIDHSWKVI